MTAGQLAHLTVRVLSMSPVYFELPNGERLEYVGWRNDGPAAGEDGRPTGTPVLVMVLKEAVKHDAG